MGKRKFDDPDVRKQCPVCCGPVYYDEAGWCCPDCAVSIAAMKAQNHAARPPRTPGIKVCTVIFTEHNSGE